jgi:hypothetical protein
MNDDDDINYDDDDDDVAFQGCHPFFFVQGTCLMTLYISIKLIVILRNKTNDDDVETY